MNLKMLIVAVMMSGAAGLACAGDNPSAPGDVKVELLADLIAKAGRGYCSHDIGSMKVFAQNANTPTHDPGVLRSMDCDEQGLCVGCTLDGSRMNGSPFAILSMDDDIEAYLIYLPLKGDSKTLADLESKGALMSKTEIAQATKVAVSHRRLLEEERAIKSLPAEFNAALER